MKLRYLFTALLFTGAAAPLQAQSIDHMRKLCLLYTSDAADD